MHSHRNAGNEATTWERFPRAPITEALLDIRVRLPDKIGLDELEGLHTQIQDAYPNKRQRHRFHGELRVEGRNAPALGAVSGGALGYVFSDAGGQRIVQARLDGFTLNWLKPYDCWSNFRTEAQTQWERYRAVAHPEAITRLALRYINRILLPLPIGDFKDYVLTVPEVAPGLPQQLAGFFTRILLPVNNSLVLITETIEDIDGESLPWILDIDAYIDGAIDPESSDIWGIFEQLRQAKNEVFFCSLTERAKELFR